MQVNPESVLKPDFKRDQQGVDFQSSLWVSLKAPVMYEAVSWVALSQCLAHVFFGALGIRTTLRCCSTDPLNRMTSVQLICLFNKPTKIWEPLHETKLEQWMLSKIAKHKSFFPLCKVCMKSFHKHMSHSYKTWWEGRSKGWRLFKDSLTLCPLAELLILFLLVIQVKCSCQKKKGGS